jgi:hypothetical protein
MVYNVMGAPLGPITFFYDRVNESFWRVKVQDSIEDPVMVGLRNDGVVIAMPGLASTVPINTFGASIVVENGA